MTFLLPLLASWLVGAGLLALDGRRAAVAWAAAATLAAVAALDLALLAQNAAAGGGSLEITTGGWPVGVGITLRVDGVSLLFAAICAGVLAAVAVHEARAGVVGRLFPALVLLLCAGLHGAFFTRDLFNFYVFFELSVVSSFALAAYGYGRAEIRGTFVYVALNLLGSVLFLFGVAAVYHAEGTLDLAELAAPREGGPARILPAALLFAALSVKLGLFPFHGWVPVLYSHARPAVATALAGALVNLAAYGMLRLGFSAMAEPLELAAGVLVALGAVAIVYGAVLALRRATPAEIAAYTSLVHAGQVVLGLGIGGPHGAAAVLLTVVAGSLDKSALFLSLDAAGAARRSASLVAATSAGGLPLTAGFVAKVQLFRAALEGPAAGVVAAAVALSSLLVLLAGVRFWRRADAAPSPRRGPTALALVAVTVAFGVWPEPWVRVVEQLSRALLGGAA